MERQQHAWDDQPDPHDAYPTSSRLDRDRHEIGSALEQSDRIMDGTSDAAAQQYLEQNVQSGGQ